MVKEIVWSETGPLLIDAVHEQTEFLRGLTGSGWSIEQSIGKGVRWNIYVAGIVSND